MTVTHRDIGPVFGFLWSCKRAQCRLMWVKVRWVCFSISVKIASVLLLPPGPNVRRIMSTETMERTSPNSRPEPWACFTSVDQSYLGEPCSTGITVCHKCSKHTPHLPAYDAVHFYTRDFNLMIVLKSPTL